MIVLKIEVLRSKAVLRCSFGVIYVTRSKDEKTIIIKKIKKLFMKRLEGDDVRHFYFILFFWLFRATPSAYESSQARGLIGATAAGLHHRHSNAGSLTH